MRQVLCASPLRQWPHATAGRMVQKTLTVADTQANLVLACGLCAAAGPMRRRAVCKRPLRNGFRVYAAGACRTWNSSAAKRPERSKPDRLLEQRRAATRCVCDASSTAPGSRRAQVPSSRRQSGVSARSLVHQRQNQRCLWCNTAGFHHHAARYLTRYRVAQSLGAGCHRRARCLPPPH